MMKKRLFQPILIVMLIVSIQVVSNACKIPVYRYALERWAPDMFEVIVFYDEEIPLEFIDALEPLDANNSDDSNFILYDVSVNDLRQPLDLIYQSTGAESLPWVLVRNANAPIGEVVWHGPVSDPAAQNLVTSPVRDAVIQSLGNGESAAWVFLPCGDDEKDNAARTLIQSQLKQMEESLELPEQDPGVPSDVLKLKFSYTEIDPNDEKEFFFKTQLLQTEPDLLAYTDEPMVFPIFGRGRVLYALIGDGISEENIRYACEFVIGACSCQVKELNPGMDLLTLANWDSFIHQSIVGEWELSLAMESNLDKLLESAKDESNIATENDNGSNSGARFSVNNNIIYISIASVAAFLILFNVGFLLLRKR